MFIGDWIQAVAVIVALAIGITSFLHTRKLRQQTLRHMLLTEIIEWAKGVSAQVDERERGVNLPSWFERWAILRADKTGMVNMADEVNIPLRQAVEDGVRMFDEMDKVVKGTQPHTANVYSDCKKSCLRILEVARSLKI